MYESKSGGSLLKLRHKPASIGILAFYHPQIIEIYHINSSCKDDKIPLIRKRTVSVVLILCMNSSSVTCPFATKFVHQLKVRQPRQSLLTVLPVRTVLNS